MVGTSQPTTLFLSFLLNFIHFSLVFHFVHYENGAGVWVTSRSYPDPSVRGQTDHILAPGRGKEMRAQAQQAKEKGPA